MRVNVRKIDNKIWNNKSYGKDRNGQDNGKDKCEQAGKSGGAEKKYIMWVRIRGIRINLKGKSLLSIFSIIVLDI